MNTHLNPTQELAAQHIEGPMLVLAGAGSGKTRTVVYRIAHLLEIGVPASDILALTFTNKAAEEMRSRIKSLSDQSILACTFHSLGARILRESIASLNYPREFTIYDASDSDQLLKTCLKTLGYKEERALLKQMRAAISGAKNDLLSPEDLDSNYQNKLDRQLKEIYTLYQTKLKEYSALDFDDLLFLTVKLFQTSKETLNHFQKRWSFILIDEYQDTNMAQYTLAKLLVNPHQNLFVVGDPDQSIYSWRGANIQNILNFERDYPGATVITLEQNYRSTSNILEGANALISCNRQRYEKKLWSSLGGGEKIGVYLAQNDHQEADFVVSKLLELTKAKNIPLKDCVIFYRVNAQSRIFEDHLIKAQIPYTIIGGLSFYQRREIKDILALLRIIVSSADFLSFARTINLPRRGIGEATLTKLRNIAEKMQIPILEACQKDLIKLSKKQADGLNEYIATIQFLKHYKAPVSDIIKEAINKSRYLDYLREDPETLEDRKANLDELVTKAAEWQEEKPSGMLPQFLEDLTLTTSLDEKDPTLDTVRLMTLHNGKGLEFTLTFIVGMEEDLFPHINAKENEESIEEERRLCYVGMTRAKRYLFLSASSYRLIWGMPKVMQPSRFLDEVPEEYLHYFSETAPEEEEEIVSTQERAFPRGAIIFHKDFGKGKIQKVYQTSLGLTYDVLFFDSNLTRSLVAKYAKFKLLT